MQKKNRSQNRLLNRFNPPLILAIVGLIGFGLLSLHVMSSATDSLVDIQNRSADMIKQSYLSGCINSAKTIRGPHGTVPTNHQIFKYCHESADSFSAPIKNLMEQ